MNILEQYKGTVEVSKDFYEVFKECMNMDPTRYFMGYVYFDKEEETFVATDGRRLISHKLRDSVERTIETGFYEPVKIGKKYKLIPANVDGIFPNWKRVIPEMKDYEAVFDEKCGISGKLSEDSRLILEIAQKTGCLFNIEFITKVLKHVDSFQVYKSIDSPLNRALMFQIDDNTQYIIMPMQQE